MGRFTKRAVIGLTAALTLAGGAVAGEFLITNFDDGSDQHNLGYYYYTYAAGTPASCNNPEVATVKNVGPANEYGPMGYMPKQPTTGCYSGAYCGGIEIDPVPTPDPYPSEPGYYPSYGFGISITKDDNTGYGTDFNKVEKISFYAMTETPGIVVYFKVETIWNSPTNPNNPHAAGYRDGCTYNVNKDDETVNAYYVAFTPTTAWAKYSFSLTPIVASGNHNGTFDAKGSVGAGKVGDLAQQEYVGRGIDFKLAEVTKIAWAINVGGTDNDVFAEQAISLFVDDVKLEGAQVNDNFYVAPWICKAPGCVVGTTFGAPAPHKVLSAFEGNDDGVSDIDYLRNSRGYYWYSYTDEVGGGESFISGLIENPHIAGNMIMNTENYGREGRGAGIDFETGGSYTQDGKTITAFVGVGANLYHDTTGTDFTNASAFQGIYFEYKTSSDVTAVNVELTDKDDAALVGGAFGVGKPVADTDGEVFFVQVPGTGEVWKSAKIAFSEFVLPGWVSTGGKRRGGASPTNPTTLNVGYLGGLKFKVDGNGIAGSIEIDNVSFYGADAWGEAGSVKFLGRTAKATGLRATYNRGVVGVNWNAAQNIASGKVSLVNVKGRTVASAPLMKSAGKVTANLGKGTIPTGMYFVRINAKDVQGKKIVQQVPLSIVK